MSDIDSEEEEKSPPMPGVGHEIPKPPIVIKKTFICTLCGCDFKSRSGLVGHMGRTIPCNETRDLNWLARNINGGSIQASISDHTLLVANFEKLSKSAKTVADIDTCRRELQKVKRKSTQLIAHLRLVALESGDSHKYNNDIAQLQTQITKLTDKYKLLLF